MSLPRKRVKGFRIDESGRAVHVPKEGAPPDSPEAAEKRRLRMEAHSGGPAPAPKGTAPASPRVQVPTVAPSPARPSARPSIEGSGELPTAPPQTSKRPPPDTIGSQTSEYWLIGYQHIGIHHDENGQTHPNLHPLSPGYSIMHDPEIEEDSEREGHHPFGVGGELGPVIGRYVAIPADRAIFDDRSEPNVYRGSDEPRGSSPVQANESADYQVSANRRGRVTKDALSQREARSARALGGAAMRRAKARRDEAVAAGNLLGQFHISPQAISFLKAMNQAREEAYAQNRTDTVWSTNQYGYSRGTVKPRTDPQPTLIFADWLEERATSPVQTELAEWLRNRVEKKDPPSSQMVLKWLVNRSHLVDEERWNEFHDHRRREARHWRGTGYNPTGEEPNNASSYEER